MSNRYRDSRVLPLDSTRWIAPLTCLFLLWSAGCASADGDTGATAGAAGASSMGGTAGTSGANAGNGGSSGNSGQSGTGGSGGASGTSGASGAAGSAGNSGAGGAGGASGGAGAGGAGGASGQGGAAGSGPSGPTSMRVNVRTWGNYFLVADQGGGGPLDAYSTYPKEWETFTLTDLDGGALQSGDKVTLQAVSGQYLSAANGGGGDIDAVSNTAGDFETFRIEKVEGTGVIESGDKVALKTPMGDRYLSVLDGGGSTVAASASAIQAWETLTLNLIGSDAYPDFGPHVFLFDAGMAMSSIQKQLDQTFSSQETNQFGDERYTYLFRPGQYDLDVQVGFYTTALGLGGVPDDVSITGGVRAKADWFNGNATQNFWRAVENLAVSPTQDANVMVWGVSQATALRRVHVKGSINLWDGGWSSGGFIADSQIDNRIDSGTQQQFLTRNSALHQWQGHNWNMVFVGDDQAPNDDWGGVGYTVVDTTPTIREKPYLSTDSAGKFSVIVPPLRSNAKGITWGANGGGGTSIAIHDFYLAHADRDDASTINAALSSGKHLLLTPGVYHLESPIHVTRASTVVMGLGLATLIPDLGTSAMVVDDVSGVTIAGVLFDAGVQTSPTLLRLGDAPGGLDHATNPTALFDVSCRVGGAHAGNADKCVEINSNDVLIDNVWLWRADHGDGVGWDTNKAKNGLVVNGDRISAYGLFVEHFEEYQTLWNGNDGRVYFYQSEIPYDVPSQNLWTHDGVDGYASYKVANNVTSHDARGLGVYSVFWHPVSLENAIETPASASIHHMITVFLGTTGGSAIRHIINGTGAQVDNSHMTSKSSN